MTTNKDQKTWLEAEKEAGKLGRVGAADVIVDGSVLSLPGDEALELLAKMGDDDLASSLSGAEAQANGDPGVDPIEPSTDSSSSTPEEPAPESSESAEGGSTPSPSAEFDVAPAADAEA